MTTNNEQAQTHRFAYREATGNNHDGGKKQWSDEEEKRARDFRQLAGRETELARTCSDVGAGRYPQRYGVKEEVQWQRSSADSKSSGIGSLIGSDRKHSRRRTGDGSEEEGRRARNVRCKRET